MMEKRRELTLEELKEIVKLAIKNDLELKVRNVSIDTIVDSDGDDALVVEFSLTFVPKKLPRDIIYDVVRTATGAIRNSGEIRHPLVTPHLAEKQLLAAG